MELSSLFEYKIKFTERGSIRLWDFLRDKCSPINFISTPEQLKDFLESSFKDITGHDINEDEYVYVRELDNQKGISSGMVSIKWWKFIAIPTLVRRFSEGKSPFTNENDFLEKIFGELGLSFMPWADPKRSNHGQD
jgi:hypothetical protein